MTTRPLERPTAHLLNHVELSYAPGDRDLARALLEALGFRVLDPQTDPIPENLGPAAGPFLIVYLDVEDGDVIDNILYASEAHPAQWQFEQALAERLRSDSELAALHRSLREAYGRVPQAMTHFGVAYSDADAVKTAMKRLEEDARIRDRLTLSPVYEPGSPGSVDDRVVQAFVYTDLVSVGLLTGGQQIELQVRLDTA